jgi:hypothetical protein
VTHYALLLTFPAIMAFAGSIDLLTMTIPNRVSLALVAAFPVAAALIGMDWTTFASHLGAGALMLVVGIGMFARGWLGGGDAKLLAAATSSWSPLQEGFWPCSFFPTVATYRRPGCLASHGPCGFMTGRLASPTASRSRPPPCGSTPPRLGSRALRPDIRDLANLLACAFPATAVCLWNDY